MSSIISIDYFVKFLIFICLIPNSITVETKIKFAFINGYNVIRCSDDQVQVYRLSEDSQSKLTAKVTCDNKDAILDKGYVGFSWNEVKIVCTSTSAQVHEEISVERKVDGHGDGISNEFPKADGSSSLSKESDELEVTNNDDEGTAVIKFKDQPADSSYFEGEHFRRSIYMWFSDHPMICRIVFHGEQNNPCEPSETELKSENVKYECYYTPGASEKPTIQEMKAEFKQIHGADKPENEDAFVLNLERPEISSDDSQESDQDEDEDSEKPSDSTSKPGNSGKGKKPLPSKPTKDKRKFSIGKVIGTILGILLLLGLIGGIAFYFFQKNRSNPSPSADIETGNHRTARVVPAESERSLTNAEELKNEIPIKNKPNIGMQTTADKKRQRVGTSMAFDNDI